MTQKLVANAEAVVRRWWQLADELIEKYADGNIYGQPQGYPAWWLKAVGYAKGPPPIPPPTTEWSFTASSPADTNSHTHSHTQTAARDARAAARALVA